MSISTVSACGASAPQATAASVGPITAPRPRCAESRDDEGERPGHHREGGSLRAALAEAFQSLGIDLPARSERSHRHEGHHHAHHAAERDDDDDRVELSAPVSATPAPAGNEVGIPPLDPVEDDLPVAPVTTRTVRSDLHDFMHELFDAARSAYASASAATSPDGTSAASTPVAAPGGRLAIGLSAVVSQIGAGQTPPALQGAFDQLMSDLSAWRATSAPTAPAETEAPAPSAAPTLQQLLGALQQRLGYGSSANDVSALGNTIDLAA